MKTSKDTTIRGYRCQKATCTYRGRKYTAWYTKQIAIRNGPYVFEGLPGLILKVSDSKNEYCFQMTGLTKVRFYDPIYLKYRREKIIKLDRAQVRKAIRNFTSDPLSVVINSGRLKVSEKDLASVKPQIALLQSHRIGVGEI